MVVVVLEDKVLVVDKTVDPNVDVGILIVVVVVVVDVVVVLVEDDAVVDVSVILHRCL